MLNKSVFSPHKPDYMESQDIRWKQRFQNFEKAFVFFEEIVNKDSYSLIDITALVKAFEFTFELGWKTIKDYLYEQGIQTSFPRAALKEGFATGVIVDQSAATLFG